MVNLTLERSLTANTGSNRVIEQLAMLNEHELHMLECLEGDINVARLALKPLLGLFPRRGHIPFVILREDVKYTKGFQQARIRESKLTIDRKETITLETLEMLTKLVKNKTGVRLDGLECVERCPAQEIDVKYYRYRVALEAI